MRTRNTRGDQVEVMTNDDVRFRAHQFVVCQRNSSGTPIYTFMAEDSAKVLNWLAMHNFITDKIDADVYVEDQDGDLYVAFRDPGHGDQYISAETALRYMLARKEMGLVESLVYAEAYGEVAK